MKQQQKKTIPTGSVFQRPYTDRHGQKKHTRTWTIRYFVNGEPVESSSGTEDYDVALGMLREKMAKSESTKGIAAARPEKVRMDQLFDLVNDINAEKPEMVTAGGVKRLVDKHLRPWFGKMRAQAVTTAEVRAYKSARLKQIVSTYRKSRKPKQADKKNPGAETGTRVPIIGDAKAAKTTRKATINKELVYLKRAFRLGTRETPPLALHVPHIELYNVDDNVRTGTVSQEAYEKVRELLPSHARIALVIGYHIGLRKGMIKKILKEKIDFGLKRIEMPDSRAVNKGAPKYIPIYGPMQDEIKRAIAAGSEDCPYLIQDDGKPVGSWKKAWTTACETAGVPLTLFHDLRRTACTNMIEAGMDEQEAMNISAHKTPSVFRRYRIVSPERLQEATGKLAAHMAAKAIKAKKVTPIRPAKAQGKAHKRTRVVTDTVTDKVSVG